MIKTFRNKELRKLFETGKSKIDANMHKKLLAAMDAVNAVTHPKQLESPGFVLHMLHQHKPVRWSIRVAHQWRITFEFTDGDAYNVDYEQYH